MRAERLGEAAMPVAGIFVLYVVAALFGFGAPAWFAVCLLLGGTALAWTMARCRWPAPAEVDRRMETANALRHRPFATLDDRTDTADPQAAALWRAHQRRAALAVRAARPGWPAPRTAMLDPLALRAWLWLLLVAGGVIAGPAAPSRLTGAFTLPAWPFTGPRLDVWITPPAYAGAPPLLLGPSRQVTVPPGSALAVLVNGPRRLPALRLGQARFAETKLTATSHRADAVIQRSGQLVIGPWWNRLGSWRITVVPPAAPLLALRSVDLEPDGRVRMVWRVTDRYGLARLNVRIVPLGAAAALPQDFALPTTNGDGEAGLDVVDDPLAGLPSVPVLSAVNRGGIGASVAPRLVFTPPAPDLRDATAATLFHLRQALALRPGEARAVATPLRRLAGAPPGRIDASADLQIAVLADALAAGATGPAAAVARLGLLIRQIEFRPAATTGPALARADQALLNALQRGLSNVPADPASLRKLLQAVDQALARHLAEARPGATAPPGPAFDLSALDRLAQRIAADETAGRTAQASRELLDLEAALEDLQSARPMTAAEAARAAAADAAARQLAGLIAGEATLRDATNGGSADPSQQAALRNALATTRAGLGHAGLPQTGLDGAARAMSAAEAALRRFDPNAAGAAETIAIEKLQNAAAALGAAGRPSLAAGPGVPAGGQDGVNGGLDDGATSYQPATSPAQAIQREIIREDAAPGLPAATHQYLRSLLDTDQP